MATIDVDATILESRKRSALATYDGRTGYQPVVALWAEQDVILADEFRDGNVPAGSGNQRVVEPALTALPAGVDAIRRHVDSALYEPTAAALAGGAGSAYAISVDSGRELTVAIRAQPATAWRPEDEDAHAVRPWAEVPYVPSDGVATKHRPEPRRYLTVRITRRRGELFADGSGRDLICWQRAKAGRVEHSHPVLTNELAAEALPSQRFGANAAWFRLKVLL